MPDAVLFGEMVNTVPPELVLASAGPEVWRSTRRCALFAEKIGGNPSLQIYGASFGGELA